MSADRAAVLLYDGECGFCSRGVLFCYRRDPRARLRFAPLRSEVAQRMLREHGVPLDMTTVVLVDAKGAHVRSDAVLRAARLLRWPWSWTYAFAIVPRPLRDALYRGVARHRHRFGPAVEACANPTPELRARML
jgi:predicted DCC family thiol-disulfide oxidoreductase YuxK